MNHPTLASLAHGIEELTPSKDGFVFLYHIKDEDYVRGDETGLLCLAALIVAQVAGDEANRSKLQTKISRMVPGGNISSLGVWPVEDPEEIEQFRQRFRSGTGILGTALFLFVLFVFLVFAVIGVVAFVRWVF